MAQIRTKGLEQELLAGKAAQAVGATEKDRKRVAEARHAERQAQLARLERDSREDDRG